MAQPQTPLRYPGGKQRLTPFVRELLQTNEIDGHYVEPYAGGAGVAIELLVGGYVKNIHLNDSSLPVYAFWNSVLTRSDALCSLIRSASLTIEEWRRRQVIVRDPANHDELEVGFSTFYLNRCNRSGILGGGVIGGLAQTGTWKMDARFPRNELIRRVELIASKRDAITLRNLDAERFILDYIPALPANTLVYCDPPYFANSQRLYLNRYTHEDHERIAAVIQTQLPRKWAVSYDGAPEIINFYQQRKGFTYDLQYNAARVYKGKEVFIFSDDLALPGNSTLPYIDHGMHTRRAPLQMTLDLPTLAHA